ncbi:alpha/beta fold hydrolase [Bacterioplanes sanyensis]|uniref:alpha/beta fold hydrolase n=1 Tax=Bacterioplanes sanyensis TaxID=1249553 RepID=UPI001675B153|nr:alpha/beta hydrolase [Bacterioplanes sanyensis]
MPAPTSCLPSSATSTSDTPLVLLRGLVRAQFHWGDFPLCLQQTLPHHTLWQPELPGNGELWQQTSPLSIPAMTDAIRRQLPEQRPLHIIAISMGAMIASDWAKRYPHEVSELHLINTSFANLALPWQRMQPRALLKLLQAALHWRPSRARLEAAIWQQTVNEIDVSKKDRADCLADWTVFAHQHPLSIRNALRQLWAASRFRGPLGAPCARTALYASQGDRLVNWRCSQRIAQQWHCPLHLHPSAGHDLPLQDPNWLLHQLQQQRASWHSETNAADKSVAEGR